MVLGAVARAEVYHGDRLTLYIQDAVITQLPLLVDLSEGEAQAGYLELLEQFELAVSTERKEERNR
jgi:hypothetical protein